MTHGRSASHDPQAELIEQVTAAVQDELEVPYFDYDDDSKAEMRRDVGRVFGALAKLGYTITKTAGALPDGQ